MASYKGNENVKVEFKSFYSEIQIRQYIEELNSKDIIDFQFFGHANNGDKNFMIVTKKEEDEYLDW
ncbi:hypothetical protein BU074_11660 [Mammaliicoccus vitulinus]|uniref:hypothetical protein n=1 Tax=Mammaliicoccus vitulinus TaxID=71237 RepID=UPI000D1D6ED4|nr:hypothetical protein [Mammaliicoccus vitulinus]PTI36092.1 hypothetical protein BU074_11660 [Mammaliicoccus vitulinus]